MAGIGVSEEWLEFHGFLRDGMTNHYIHWESEVGHNLETGHTWVQDLDWSVSLYPKSGKELLLCVKLRTP